MYQKGLYPINDSFGYQQTIAFAQSIETVNCLFFLLLIVIIISVCFLLFVVTKKPLDFSGGFCYILVLFE